MLLVLLPFIFWIYDKIHRLRQPLPSSFISLNTSFLFIYRVILAQSTPQLSINHPHSIIINPCHYPSQSPFSSVPGGSGQYMQRRAVSMILSMMAFIMGATVLSNAYMGNMLSHLLIPKQNAPINTLEELVASSLNWLISGGTAEETLFMVLLRFRFYFLRAFYSRTIQVVFNGMEHLI